MKHRHMLNCVVTLLLLSGRAGALIRSHPNTSLIPSRIADRHGSATMPLNARRKNLPHYRSVARSRTSQLNLFGSTAAAATAAVTLPTWKAATLGCLVPSCMGFYKQEYGVSYAYGKLHEAPAIAVLFKFAEWLFGCFSLTYTSVCQDSQLRQWATWCIGRYWPHRQPLWLCGMQQP